MKLGNKNQNSGIFFRWKGRGLDTYGEHIEMAAQGGDAPSPCGFKCTGDSYNLQAASHYPQITGEYNNMTVFAHGNFIEFWVRNEKVNEINLASEQWKALVADKKSNSEIYGRHPTGYIVIQDHGVSGTNKCDELWVRNIRVRGFSTDSRAPAPLIDIKKITDDSALVSMDVGISGAVIRYSTDGSTPNETSKLYSEPFGVKGNAGIKALAYRQHLQESEITSTDYVTDVIGFKTINKSIIFNPAQLQITVNLSGNYQLDILNIKGQKIVTEKGSGRGEFRFKKIKKAGRYFVKVKAGDKEYTRSITILK